MKYVTENQQSLLRHYCTQGQPRPPDAKGCPPYPVLYQPCSFHPPKLQPSSPLPSSFPLPLWPLFLFQSMEWKEDCRQAGRQRWGPLTNMPPDATAPADLMDGLALCLQSAVATSLSRFCQLVGKSCMHSLKYLQVLINSISVPLKRLTMRVGNLNVFSPLELLGKQHPINVLLYTSMLAPNSSTKARSCTCLALPWLDQHFAFHWKAAKDPNYRSLCSKPLPGSASKPGIPRRAGRLTRRCQA